MSGYWFKNGQTGAIVRIKLNDSSQTIPNNKGITGLSSTSTGLIIATMCDVEPTATTYTQAGSTIQTIASLGTYAAPSANNCRFSQVDSTNYPGWYEMQFLNARFAVSNAKYLGICVPAVAGLNLAQQDLVIPLTNIDPYNAASIMQASSTFGVPTFGTAGTYEQQLNMLLQALTNFSISGTTLTINNLSNSSAATCTLNSASTPTSIQRAT